VDVLKVKKPRERKEMNFIYISKIYFLVLIRSAFYDTPLTFEVQSDSVSDYGSSKV